MSKAYLLLENGMVFEGEGFGAAGTRVGELVFTTGMTGCAREPDGPELSGPAHHLHLPHARQLRHLL